MAFLSPNDILVTEKNTGTVRRIVNGTLFPRPLLDVNVDTFAHRGLLGIAIGPDNNLYLSVGDIGIGGHLTKAQNIQNGSDPDGTSGILRVDEDGRKVNPEILGSKYPLDLYYSCGLWNSFGMDFDPVSGKLWDTENGLIFIISIITI